MCQKSVDNESSVYFLINKPRVVKIQVCGTTVTQLCLYRSAFHD